MTHQLRDRILTAVLALLVVAATAHQLWAAAYASASSNINQKENTMFKKIAKHVVFRLIVPGIGASAFYAYLTGEWPTGATLTAICLALLFAGMAD